MAKLGHKSIIVITAIVLTIIAVAAAWAVPYFHEKAGVGATIRISPDMSLDALGDSLSAFYGNGFAHRTTRALAWMDVDLSSRCGSYSVDRSDTPISLAKKIRNRAQTPVKFTFNNLRLKEQFAQRASQQLMMKQEEIAALLNDSTVCAKYGKDNATIVNILLPDTYEMYWNVSPEDFLDRLYRYYNQFWDDERKQKASQLGLTPDEVHTIASIVEEESAKTDEYGTIARLYINRVQKGMPLQADPTIKYAIGDFSVKRITKPMLDTPSAYNTYINTGLPPGPIRIASKRAIDAVLNAPKHNFLYMCAKEDFSGYHNFTASYAQHTLNARRYQAELNRRNIK